MRHTLLTLIFLSLNLLITARSSGENSSIQGNQIAIALEYNSVALTSEQTSLLLASGILLIELSQPDQIDLFGEEFNFLVGSGQPFLLNSALSRDRNKITEEAVYQIRQFRQRAPGRILGYNLFHYPHDDHSLFFSEADRITQAIRSSENIPIYYRSFQYSLNELPSSFDFVSLRFTADQRGERISDVVFHFKPGADLFTNLTSLEWLLNTLVTSDESLIIIPSDWFFETITRMPDLQLLFAEHTRGKPVEMILPYPGEQLNRTMDTVLIFTLLFWVFLGLLFRYRPLFIELFTRYFFNHSFLVSDLAEFRLRNKSEALFMLSLNTFIGGFFAYTALTLFFGDTGLEVIVYYLPMTYSTELLPLIVFFAGALFTFLMHLISLSWLALFNKELRKLPLLLNLYAWPFLLNLFPLTLLVFLTQTEASGLLSVTGLILFFLLFPFAHLITAFQGSKQLENRRFLNLLFSALGFTLFYLSLFYLTVTARAITEPLLLALWLS